MGVTVRLVIAEDHAILREGVKSLLEAEGGFQVVGEAADGIEAVRRVEETRPDLVLLDLSMPRQNGIAAIREIHRLRPETKILALTAQKSEDYVLAALEAGAHGYCLKDADAAGLLSAIRQTLAGGRYIAPGIQGVKAASGDGKPQGAWESLTPREKEVLKLIGEGYRNKEIAEFLFISVKTVERHRANLMGKLDLHGTADLTAYAIEKGLVCR
jgi:DNA-binding NarL/FixJ family response regulator